MPINSLNQLTHARVSTAMPCLHVFNDYLGPIMADELSRSSYRGLVLRPLHMSYAPIDQALRTFKPESTISSEMILTNKCVSSSTNDFTATLAPLSNSFTVSAT